MRLADCLGSVLIVGAVGCPAGGDIAPSTDTEPASGSDGTLSDASSSGDIEPTTSGSSGDVDDVCCETILPAWELCSETPSTVLDMPRVLTGLAPMPDSARGGGREAGQTVTHAWESLSSYVFVGKDSARRISMDGVETDLWRGEGEAVDALLHEGALYLSVSLENETGRPGSGRNQVLQIPLEGGAPERLVDISIDDVRQVVRFGSVDEGLVYLSVPGPNSIRILSVLAL